MEEEISVQSHHPMSTTVPEKGSVMEDHFKKGVNRHPALSKHSGDTPNTPVVGIRTDTEDHNGRNLGHHSVTYASVIPDLTAAVDSIKSPAHETVSPIYEETLAHKSRDPLSPSTFNTHIYSIDVALKNFNPNETTQ